MAVCTHCGRESQGYERFCMSCGQPLGNSGPAAVNGASGMPVWQRPTSESGQDSANQAVDSPQAAGDVSRADSAVATAQRSRLIVYRLASADGGSEDGPSIEVGEFILDGRDIAIGRAPSCDIVLEGDQLASRRHALMRSHPDGYTVVDLGSSNGTYINDLEIREAVLLHESDHISIGGHELIYSTSPASPHASLAGVKLEPPEVLAMQDTDPHGAAMSSQETAEAPAVVGSAAPEPEGAPVASADEQPDVARAGEPEAPPSEAMAFEQNVVEVYQAASEPDFSSSSLTDADFESLRAQLAEVSEALTRKATSEARVIKQLRGALKSARDQIAWLVDTSSSSATPGTASARDVSELISIARQAAENPRHLDYLTALAAHAGDIADTLESGESDDSGVSHSLLERLRAQLDAALE
jgi:pSer/pThr/pTyr-binding forkhead associated (FHA) protein